MHAPLSQGNIAKFGIWRLSVIEDLTALQLNTSISLTLLRVQYNTVFAKASMGICWGMSRVVENPLTPFVPLSHSRSLRSPGRGGFAAGGRSAAPLRPLAPS